MIAQFGTQHPLHQRLLELPQQPAATEQVFRPLAALQQLVQNLVVDCLPHGPRHPFFSACTGGRLHRKPDTLVGSAEYRRRLGEAAAPAQNATGTFRAIIAAYQRSGEWRQLKPRTQTDYRIWLDRIDAKFGDAPIEAFNRPGIRAVALKWRDGWQGKQAQYAWTVLRRVVSWAYDRNLLKQHHLTRGGRVYRANRADLIWTPTEIEATCAAATPEVANAITLMLWTGLAPCDLVRLDRWHIKPTPKGRRIEIHRAKTETLAAIPVLAAAAKVIDATPDGRTRILQSPRGKPWHPGHLSKEVKRFARLASVREALTMYDLRGNACTRLLSEGCTIAEIALAMGWSPAHAAAMVQVYAALDPAITDSILARLEPAETGTEAVKTGAK